MQQKTSFLSNLVFISDVIAYHLVHFISIWVINKCQSGIDFFFLLASAQCNSSFMNKISVPSPFFFAEKHYDESETLLKCQQGDEIRFRYNKIR